MYSKQFLNLIKKIDLASDKLRSTGDEYDYNCACSELDMYMYENRFDLTSEDLAKYKELFGREYEIYY